METSDPGHYEVSIHLTLSNLLRWSDNRTISITVFKGPGSNQLKKLSALKLSPGWQGRRFKWWKEFTPYDKVFKKSKGRLKLDCGSVIRLSRQSEYGSVVLAPFRTKKRNQTICVKLAVEALQYDRADKGGGQVKINFVQLKKLCGNDKDQVHRQTITHQNMN